MKGQTMKSKLGLFSALFLSALCASAVDVSSDVASSSLGTKNGLTFTGDYTVTVDNNYTVTGIDGGAVDASFYIAEGGSLTLSAQKVSNSSTLEGSITFDGVSGSAVSWENSSGYNASFIGKMDGNNPLLTVIFNTDLYYSITKASNGFDIHKANYQFNKNVTFNPNSETGRGIDINVGEGNNTVDVTFGEVGSATEYTAVLSRELKINKNATVTVNKNYTLSNIVNAATVNEGATLNIEEGGKVLVKTLSNSGTVNVKGGTLAITTGEIAQSVIDGLNITKPSTIEVFDIKLKGHTLDYGTLAVNGNAIINTGTFTIEEGNSFIVNTTTNGGSYTNGTGSTAGIVDINGTMLITGGAFCMWNDSRINVNSTGSLGTAEKAVTVLEIYSKTILNLDGYSNINTLRTATTNSGTEEWQTINVTSSTNNIETLGINSAILNVENGGKLTVANLTVNETAEGKNDSYVNIKNGGILEVTKSLNLSSTNFNLSGTLILGALETSSITGKILVDGGKLVVDSSVVFAGGLKIADGTTMQIEMLNGNTLEIYGIEGENICLDFISDSTIEENSFYIGNIEKSYLESIDIKLNGSDALVDYEAFDSGYFVNIQIPEPADYAVVFALLALGFVAYRKR